jgi:hypothetical protein
MVRGEELAQHLAELLVVINNENFRVHCEAIVSQTLEFCNRR